MDHVPGVNQSETGDSGKVAKVIVTQQRRKESHATQKFCHAMHLINLVFHM